MPLSEIHPYSTSSSLSRRQFLKMLLTFSAGLACPGFTHAAGNQVLPAWWMSLTDGHIRGPAAIPHGLPGSLMKLVGTAALLEERLISPNTEFECRGSQLVDGRSVRCQHAHGILRLQEALGVSCNIFFAQASENLSARRFLQYARMFRLDRSAGTSKTVYFPEEAKDIALAYLLGLHGDFQPNAAQLLRMTGLIAQQQVPGLQPATWKILQGGMRLCATGGTASKVDPENRFQLAAKTGTAPYGERYRSWLVGYFPFDNPKYAFCVRANAGTAMENAVPLARQLLKSKTWTLS